MTPNSTAEPAPAMSDAPARGQIVVVTGASSGLGLETAKQMASQGAQIVMVCRDRSRGEHAQMQITQVATGESPVLLLADLSVQDQVRRLAEDIRARYRHIDILINNAGTAYRQRQLSADGIEQTWATNHLGALLLTELLLPLIVASPAGRIVTVTSEIYSRKLDLENLQGESKYSFFGAYRISKLGNVLFTRELARRLNGSGVAVISVSPGPAKTNFGGDGPGGVMGAVTGVMRRTPLFRPADQAAQGIVWAATAPGPAATPGGLYMRRKQLPFKGAAADLELAGRVWRLSAEQVGLDPDR